MPVHISVRVSVIGVIQKLRGHRFVHFWPPTYLRGHFLCTKRGQKWQILDHLPTPSCPRGYWMPPYLKWWWGKDSGLENSFRSISDLDLNLIGGVEKRNGEWLEATNRVSDEAEKFSRISVDVFVCWSLSVWSSSTSWKWKANFYIWITMSISVMMVVRGLDRTGATGAWQPKILRS